MCYTLSNVIFNMYWWLYLSTFCICSYSYICIILENCALLGYYESSMGNLLLMFWDKLLVPLSRKNSLKMGSIGCPETSVRSYPYLLCNNSEECSSYLLGGEAWNHACIILVCCDIQVSDQHCHCSMKSEILYSSFLCSV